jgi:hypothetical protein
MADGYEISRGRSDWQGAVTAGELRLTLNNSDGRFTPGSTTLASPSPIIVDQQIRVKETVNGVTYTRFTGYVKSWPVSWPATVVTFATVPAGATDAQARAERTTLRSMLEEEVVSASPSAYYTLGESEGSTSAGDTSGSQAVPLTAVGTGTAFTMGTGTGPVDGLSATQFFAGQYLADTAAVDFAAAPTTIAIMCVFATTDPATVTILNHHGWLFQINGTFSTRLTAQGPGFSINSTSVINDGRTHVAVLIGDGATATLIIDGNIEDTGAIGSGTGVVATRVGQQFTGTMSHVAVWPTLTTTQGQTIGQIALGLTESGTARITRLAGYADIPVGTLDTSLTSVSAQATLRARRAFSAIQDVADAEGGLVFIDGSGNLTFHNRDRPSVKTTPDLT